MRRNGYYFHSFTYHLPNKLKWVVGHDKLTKRNPFVANLRRQKISNKDKQVAYIRAGEWENFAARGPDLGGISDTTAISVSLLVVMSTIATTVDANNKTLRGKSIKMRLIQGLWLGGWDSTSVLSGWAAGLSVDAMDGWCGCDLSYVMNGWDAMQCYEEGEKGLYICIYRDGVVARLLVVMELLVDSGNIKLNALTYKKRNRVWISADYAFSSNGFW